MFQNFNINDYHKALVYSLIIIIFFALLAYKLYFKGPLDPFAEINSVDKCEKVEGFKDNIDGQDKYYSLCYHKGGIIRLDDLNQKLKK